jgi:hypothetical protein
MRVRGVGAEFGFVASKLLVVESLDMKKTSEAGAKSGDGEF